MAKIVCMLVCGVLVVACKKPTPDSSPCREEMVKIEPALEATLAPAPTQTVIDDFHAATETFAHATMCGPDAAQQIRRWEAALRTDTSAGRASARRDLLHTLDEVAVQEDWSPSPAIAHAIDQARTPK